MADTPTRDTLPWLKSQYAESEEMMELKDATCMSILKMTMVSQFHAANGPCPARLSRASRGCSPLEFVRMFCWTSDDHGIVSYVHSAQHAM